VHDHNLSDHASDRTSQKGTQASTFEVDARSDVGDELVSWVGSAEVGHLPLEIGTLLG
jgi:hypothetical protein